MQCIIVYRAWERIICTYQYHIYHHIRLYHNIYVIYIIYRWSVDYNSGGSSVFTILWSDGPIFLNSPEIHNFLLENIHGLLLFKWIVRQTVLPLWLMRVAGVLRWIPISSIPLSRLSSADLNLSDCASSVWSFFFLICCLLDVFTGTGRALYSVRFGIATWFSSHQTRFVGGTLKYLRFSWNFFYFENFWLQSLIIKYLNPQITTQWSI